MIRISGAESTDTDFASGSSATRALADVAKRWLISQQISMSCRRIIKPGERGMSNLSRIPLQVVAYAAFAAVVGYFATMPRYQYSDPGMAGVKISLSHAADRVEECVQLTQEQIAELAANMRTTESCERQRLPLFLELDVDGSRVLEIEAPPSGLWGDGPASVYERFNLEPGSHEISIRMRSTGRAEGWDYVKTDKVALESGRYFTVTFKAATGGFKFR